MKIRFTPNAATVAAQTMPTTSNPATAYTATRRPGTTPARTMSFASRNRLRHTVPGGVPGVSARRW
ncbi:hypothetical protein GCM10027167_79400 [Nocardia heshunensis]